MGSCHLPLLKFCYQEVSSSMKPSFLSCAKESNHFKHCICHLWGYKQRYLGYLGVFQKENLGICWNTFSLCCSCWNPFPISLAVFEVSALPSPRAYSKQRVSDGLVCCAYRFHAVGEQVVASTPLWMQIDWLSQHLVVSLLALGLCICDHWTKSLCFILRSKNGF